MNGFTRKSIFPLALAGVLLLAGAAASQTYITSWELVTVEPQPGQDLRFDADLTEDPASLWLYYRIDGGGWESVSMADKSGGGYNGYVSDPSTTDGCLVEWYIQGLDGGLGNDRAPDSDYESFTVSFIDEAVGIYLDDAGFAHEYDTPDGPGEFVQARLVLRYPHMWDTKTWAYVQDWQMTVTVDGDHSLLGGWTLSGGATNSAKAVRSTTDVTEYDFVVTTNPSPPLEMDDDADNAIVLAYTDVWVATGTTLITFKLGPVGANAAPQYRPDGSTGWRRIGTSGGGDPGDPGEDWSQICAQINGPGGVVHDRSATWSAVKALFR